MSPTPRLISLAAARLPRSSREAFHGGDMRLQWLEIGLHDGDDKAEEYMQKPEKALADKLNGCNSHEPESDEFL